MSKASDLFERIAKRCSFPPGGGKWAGWISEEMKKTEHLEDKAIEIQRLEEDEKRRHQNAMKELKAKWTELQKYCPHEEMVRPDVNDPAYCKLCGYSETEYRRS